MPVDRLTAQAAGVELVRLFEALELELAHGVALRLARGIDDQDDWAQKKHAAAGELRSWAQALVQRTVNRGARAVLKSVATAFLSGGRALDKELGVTAAADRQIPNQRTIGVLARALTVKLDAAGLQVVRSTVDAYQRIVTRTAATVLGGASTRRDAAQRAYSSLLNEGLTAFTDKAGRRWSLSGYVDMATRTTVAQAAVQGQLERQADLGLDLVIVSNAPQECVKCRPWEGKILTRDESGRGGADIRVEHATEDRIITVHVAGSVNEAIAAGLMHPNCRHSLSAYLPGLTKAPTHTADPEGDAARQKLRALERATREAKLRQAAALTPGAKRAAATRVRDLQRDIKAHVAKHDLTRRTDREQPNLGLGRTSAPRPAPTSPPAAPKAAPQPAPAAPPVPRYEGPIDARLSDAEVATTRKALDRQAALTPETIKRLAGVERATPEDMARLPAGAAAFYRVTAKKIFVPDGSLGERMRAPGMNAMESGWWTKCDHADAGAGHILAHEYGHHVHYAGMSAHAESSQVARLWETFADDLGVPRPVIDADPYGGKTVHLNTWFARNKAAIARAVSTYGSKDDGECLAEIWAEYSNLGDRARPIIRKIGKMMQDIAEQGSRRKNQP